MPMDSQGRKLYSLAEAFRISFNAFRSLPKIKKAEAAGLIDDKFKERIMLAVTEVNGCALCSYSHTQMALEAGMSDQEIAALLQGIFDDVPSDELPAIIFAQHYADSRGRPTKGSLEQIVERYGQEKASAIVSVIRVIMMGNTYGVPLGSFGGRLKRQPQKIDPRSNIGYEIAMLLSLIIYIPVCFIAALLAQLMGAK